MFSSPGLNVDDVPRPLDSGVQVLETRIIVYLELAIRGLRHSGRSGSTEIALEGL